MVTRTRVNVTLYVNCLSCWFHIRTLAYDFIKLVCMKIQVPLLNYILQVFKNYFLLSSIQHVCPRIVQTFIVQQQ